LALSILLVLRDACLPQPVGTVCWSPWIDLYHSLPSVFSNASTDYIPNGFVHKASPANPIKNYKNVQERLDRVQYYAYNSALSIPYVSPILADDLGGLGEIFITCGSGERLRDEAILLAHKAAKTHPEIFECNKPGVRSYPPTKVSLNVYEAMPHVFQLFLFHPAASNAMKRTGAFIQKIIPEPTNDASSCSSHSSCSSSPHSSSPHSSFSSSHHHRENDTNLNDLKQKNSSSSFSLQEFIDDEFDDVDDNGEINYFTSKHIDIKGNCKRTNDMLDEGTLREWMNMLGKLPDLDAHPEFMDI
jgi:hypothetical protein